MSLEGTVKNGVVVFDNDNAPPEGTRVEVVIKGKSKPASTLGQRLLDLAGIAEDLPEDLAEQHDHYLHGLPKR